MCLSVCEQAALSNKLGGLPRALSRFESYLCIGGAIPQRNGDSNAEIFVTLETILLTRCTIQLVVKLLFIHILQWFITLKRWKTAEFISL